MRKILQCNQCGEFVKSEFQIKHGDPHDFCPVQDAPGVWIEIGECLDAPPEELEEDKPWHSH